MKYDDVKKDLGDECLDITTNQNGLDMSLTLEKKMDS